MTSRLMNVTVLEGKGGMGYYDPKKVMLLDPVEVEVQEAELQKTTDLKVSPTHPSAPKPKDH